MKSDQETIVHLDRVTKRFGEVTAIDCLNMDIMAGESSPSSVLRAAASRQLCACSVVSKRLMKDGSSSTARTSPGCPRIAAM